MPHWTTSLAMICASLGLVFVGVAGFQAVLRLDMVGHPWALALGLWAAALVLVVIGRRSDRPGPEDPA